MILDIKKLHKNFLNKRNDIRMNGCTTDIVVALIQSCEVNVGNYCLLTNTLNEAYRLNGMFIDLTRQISNIEIVSNNSRGKYISFNNGSKIFFEYGGCSFENIYFDINNLTSDSKYKHFRKTFVNFLLEKTGKEFPVEMAIDGLTKMTKQYFGYTPNRRDVLQDLNYLKATSNFRKNSWDEKIFI